MAPGQIAFPPAGPGGNFPLHGFWISAGPLLPMECKQNFPVVLLDMQSLYSIMVIQG